MTLEVVIGLVVAVGGFAAFVAKVLLAIGEAKRLLNEQRETLFAKASSARIDDFERRYNELAKEVRERLLNGEARTNLLERDAAVLVAKLAGIHDQLIEIRALLSARRGEP